jgi:outer membrane protein assembly factor BamB
MSLANGTFEDVNPDGTPSSTTMQGINLQEALDPLGNIVWASDDWDSPGWSLRRSSPSGAETWRTTLTANPTAPPTVDADGTIYLSTDEGLSAFKGSDGTPMWTFSGSNGALTSAAIGPDGIAYLGDASGVIYAVGP